MLARISSGKDGIVEYLVDGMKQGRELSRDELDRRFCIEGELSLTDEVIKTLNQSGRKDNYLHITLSFNERELSEEVISNAYHLYKEKLMTAFDASEYNVYAEAHFPKVKSYQDKKTGETIHRYPHVHIVIPKLNLLDNKYFDPMGGYALDAHDAIQETVNRQLGFSSPYDHQRFTVNKSNAEFISRYKGDTFGNGKRAKLKAEWFDLIAEKDIRTVDEFKHALAEYGEVGIGKAGAQDSYIKIKPHGDSRFIRLKESCFKSGYIEKRELQREKPSDKLVAERLAHWENTQCLEMKYIRPASMKVRDEYHQLHETEKEAYLHERQNDHRQRYHLRESRRQASRQPRTERVGLNRFAQVANGLPSLPPRALVRANGERPAVSESLLPSHEHHHMESARAGRNHQLRRPIVGHGGRSGRLTPHTQSATQGLPNANSQSFSPGLSHSESPSSVPERLLAEHHKDIEYQRELAHFRVVRQKLSPEALLERFERSHGLVPDHYSVWRAKDGSGRIQVDSRSFNVSDFCTKHMHLSWNDTKTCLSEAYRDQVETRQERQVINSISFVSRSVTQGYRSQAKLARLDESIQILHYLQRQEQFAGDPMSMSLLEKYRNTDEAENAIEDEKLSLNKTANHLLRQQQLAEQLTLKMSDLVANKDLKKQKVNFMDKQSGEKVFQDIGHKLVMANRKPDIDHVSAAMTLAAEKFGVVKISGTKEFKQQVIDVAVIKELNVVFADKKMQARFVEQQQAHKERLGKEYSFEDILNENKQENRIEKNDGSRSQSDKQADEPQVKASLPTLINHGAAPYQHIEDNKRSYFVELSDGQTLWGVGLEKAIKDSGANLGDAVNVHRTGKEAVKIEQSVLDEQGKEVGKKWVETNRNAWKVEVSSPVQTEVAASDEVKAIDQFATAYAWDKDSQQLTVTVNDQSPSALPTDTLEKIIQRDKFLSCYSLEEVQHGHLDVKKAEGAQAVPKVYDANAHVIDNVDTESSQASRTLK